MGLVDRDLMVIKMGHENYQEWESSMDSFHGDLSGYFSW